VVLAGGQLDSLSNVSNTALDVSFAVNLCLK